MTIFRDMSGNEVFIMSGNSYFSIGTNVSCADKDYVVMSCGLHKRDVTVYIMPKNDMRTAMIPLYAVIQMIDNEINDEVPDFKRLRENISNLKREYA